MCGATVIDLYATWVFSPVDLIGTADSPPIVFEFSLNFSNAAQSPLQAFDLHPSLHLRRINPCCSTSAGMHSAEAPYHIWQEWMERSHNSTPHSRCNQKITIA